MAKQIRKCDCEGEIEKRVEIEEFLYWDSSSECWRFKERSPVEDCVTFVCNTCGKEFVESELFKTSLDIAMEQARKARMDNVMNHCAVHSCPTCDCYCGSLKEEGTTCLSVVLLNLINEVEKIRK